MIQTFKTLKNQHKYVMRVEEASAKDEPQHGITGQLVLNKLQIKLIFNNAHHQDTQTHCHFLGTSSNYCFLSTLITFQSTQTETSLLVHCFHKCSVDTTFKGKGILFGEFIRQAFFASPKSFHLLQRRRGVICCSDLIKLYCTI